MHRIAIILSGLTGWTYLLAGSVLLAAAAVIPAQQDLERARLLGARADAQVEYRRGILDECGTRLAALAEPNDALLASLAQTHLNLAPEGSRPLSLPLPPARATLAAEHRRAEPETSLLSRLVTRRPARPLVVVLASVCVLIGLLPPATARPPQP